MKCRMNTFLKTVCMVLLIVMLASPLTGCKVEGPGTESKSTESKIDFEGKTIVISSWTDAEIPALGKSESADAVYYALEYAKKKYNCNVEWKILPEQQYFNAFVQASLSGTKYSDIALAHCWTYASWIKNDLLKPTTKFIDNAPDKERWSKNYSMLKGEVYEIKKQNNSVIPQMIFFYNTKIINELKLESPQKLAREGKWTWDKFREYCRLATDKKSDRYGVSAFMLPDALRYTNGFMAYEFDKATNKFYNGYTYTGTKKNALELLDLLRAMAIDDKSILGDMTGGEVTMNLAWNSFVEGKLLFTYGREPQLLKSQGFTDYAPIIAPLGPSGKKLDNYIDSFSFWALPSVSDFNLDDRAAFWMDAQRTWDESRGNAYYKYNRDAQIENIFAKSYMSKEDVEFLFEMGKGMRNIGTLNSALKFGETEVHEIYGKVLRGESTPAAVIAATDNILQTKIDNLLNK